MCIRDRKNRRPNLDQLKLTRFLSILLLAGLAALCGCGTAKISSRRELATPAPGAPGVIYVQDFELSAARIQSEPGLLPSPPKAPGPLGDLPPLPGTPKEPEELARDLVNTMSTSLVKDLTKAGVSAHRLESGVKTPASGWLVRGVFTEANQGNQLRRAVIGFGAGKTELQVLLDVADLSLGTPQPFYSLSTTADSGQAPGAGPTIVLGPAGVAARYVIAGNDLKRNVKQTAAKIAEEVVRQAR